MIQEALDRLMRGRTTLILAHRLSSVIAADRILVLEHGRVVESGRHDELMRRDGPYRRLMGAQATEEKGSGVGRHDAMREDRRDKIAIRREPAPPRLPMKPGSKFATSVPMRRRWDGATRSPRSCASSVRGGGSLR